MTEPDHTDATGAPPVPEIDVLLLFAGEHPIHAPIAPVQAQRLPPQPLSRHSPLLDGLLGNGGAHEGFDGGRVAGVDGAGGGQRVAGA